MCASTRRPGSQWLLGLSLWLAAALSQAAEPFVWPHGAKAAVSLAYDDALASQLDNAIPVLDRHGLKATFYLTLGSDTVRTRLADWRAAAARGHELGNHTLFHQCSAQGPDRSWVTPDNDLDRVSAAQMVAQVRVGNILLQAIDGKQQRTFAVPCGDAVAGGVNYLPALRGDFLAMKSRFGGVPETMEDFDPHAVSVYAAADVTGEQLIEVIQRAARLGTMANITFHGVGGDFLSVSSQAHAQLLAYLAANRATYWTDSFLNVMRYVVAKSTNSKP